MTSLKRRTHAIFFSLQKIEMKSEMLEMKGVRKFKVDIKVDTMLYMNVDKRLN